MNRLATPLRLILSLPKDIFVILAPCAPGLHGDRRARLGDQLLGCFVEANERMQRIMGPLIDFQHVFHARGEGGAGVGWNHPLLLEMRLERIFFRTRPIVLSLA
jgi:hypothetical protein